MYKRVIVILISILTCCTFVCVGFSAWSIVAENSVTGYYNGAILSEPIIYSDDYVRIDQEKMPELNQQSFVVSPYGFVHKQQDGTVEIDPKGTLQIPLIIDTAKCTEVFSDNFNIEIYVSFSKGNAQLWQTNNISTDCNNEDINVTGSSFGSSGEGYAISFTVPTNINSIIIYLNFTFSSVDVYQRLLYEKTGYITQSGTETKVDDPFIFEVRVSG